MKAGSKLRSLSARLLQAQDEERRRISRELHDSVGQALVAARMSLNRAIQSDHRHKKEDLQECLQFIEGALREVRSVSYLLHPPMLDLVGLTAAIRGYVEGFNRRTDITLHLEIPENLPRLSLEKETAAFRIIQECLTNVHRYSGASNAWVRIRSGENECFIEVQDDGKGIATADLPGVKVSELSIGVGIPGMRERLRELGGSLDIQSSNHGTRVIATIPMGEDQDRSGSGELVITREKTAAGDLGTERNGSRKRIVVVEDHELMRRGIRTLIENQPDLEICGEAVTAAEAIDVIRELKPDVVILDLQLPSGNGWEVVRGIRRFDFCTRILIFTTHSYHTIANTARAAQCEGCLTKSRASTDLIKALRTVLSGQTFYPDAASSQSA